MRTENSIIIHNVPRETIFETAANLSLWPKILPHYRWIKFLDLSATKSIVQMAARRNWIPVQWTSIQEIDREHMEIRFLHLKAFTKGMKVVWTFTTMPNGVEVRIRHNLTSQIPLVGNFIADQIVGKFFVHYIANQTLTHMKKHLESTHAA